MRDIAHGFIFKIKRGNGINAQVLLSSAVVADRSAEAWGAANEAEGVLKNMLIISTLYNCSLLLPEKVVLV